MKKLIYIGLHGDLPMTIYDLSGMDNIGLIGIVENASEGTLFVLTYDELSGGNVIMCLGGGFLKTNLENEDIGFTEWFMELGVTYIAFRYRIPRDNPDVPEQDIRLVLEVVREKSPEFYDKLGVVGISIGGYLTALSAMPLSDGEKPDFQVLMRPVVSVDDRSTRFPCRKRMFGHSYSPDKMEQYSPIEHITCGTSTAFIVAAANDAVVSPLNGIIYTTRPQEVDTPISLHIYPAGGYGFGYNDSFVYEQEWFQESGEWLVRLQFFSCNSKYTSYICYWSI